MKLLLMLVAAALSACAATVNFAILDDNSGTFNSVGSSYSLGGLDFNSSGLQGAYASPSPAHPAGGAATTGFTDFSAGDTMTITRSGGGPFSLFSVDLAQYGPSGPPTFDVTFKGYDSSLNQIATGIFTVNGYSDSPVMQPFSFTGFNNVYSVQVLQGTNGADAWQFTNLSTDANGVPEPVAAPGILLALGALWTVRKERSAPSWGEPAAGANRNVNPFRVAGCYR